MLYVAAAAAHTLTGMGYGLAVSPGPWRRAAAFPIATPVRMLLWRPAFVGIRQLMRQEEASAGNSNSSRPGGVREAIAGAGASGSLTRGARAVQNAATDGCSTAATTGQPSGGDSARATTACGNGPCPSVLHRDAESLQRDPVVRVPLPDLAFTLASVMMMMLGQCYAGPRAIRSYQSGQLSLNDVIIAGLAVVTYLSTSILFAARTATHWMEIVRSATPSALRQQQQAHHGNSDLTSGPSPASQPGAGAVASIPRCSPTNAFVEWVAWSQMWQMVVGQFILVCLWFAPSEASAIRLYVFVIMLDTVCDIVAPLIFATQKIMAVDERSKIAQRVAWLSRAVRQERQANEAKKRFLRYVFHEMRVPFNTLTLGLEALSSQPDLDLDAREDLMLMRSASESMTSVMNNVLRITAIEDGNLTLHVGPSSIADVLQTVQAQMAPLAMQVQARLVMTIDRGSIPQQAMFDSDAISQVVSNLIVNSLKFVPEDGSGIVSVQAELVRVRRGKERAEKLLRQVLLGADSDGHDADDEQRGNVQSRSGSGIHPHSPNAQDDHQDDEVVHTGYGTVIRPTPRQGQHQPRVRQTSSSRAGIDVQNTMMASGEWLYHDDAGGKEQDAEDGQATPMGGVDPAVAAVKSMPSQLEAQTSYDRLVAEYGNKLGGVAWVRIVVKDNGCGMAPGLCETRCRDRDMHVVAVAQVQHVAPRFM